jgi:hypothetical protein
VRVLKTRAPSPALHSAVGQLRVEKIPAQSQEHAKDLIRVYSIRARSNQERRAVTVPAKTIRAPFRAPIPKTVPQQVPAIIVQLLQRVPKGRMVRMHHQECKRAQFGINDPCHSAMAAAIGVEPQDKLLVNEAEEEHTQPRPRRGRRWTYKGFTEGHTQPRPRRRRRWTYKGLTEGRTWEIV